MTGNGLDVETAGLPPPTPAAPETGMPGGVIPGIFICIPSYGAMQIQTFQTCLSLQHALILKGINCSFATYSFPDVAEIRNIFTTIWYDSVKMSHMLMIDNDMGFDPQLILDMLAYDKPLVGALCPKRKLPIEFAGRAKPGQVGIINGFMEVDGIGGAIMMVRRDCMEAVLTRFPGLSDVISLNGHAAKKMLEDANCHRLIRAFDHLEIQGEHFSEDLSFCLRWRACGGQVWANVMYPIIHVGTHEYTGRFFDTIQNEVQPMTDEQKAAHGVYAQPPALDLPIVPLDAGVPIYPDAATLSKAINEKEYGDKRKRGRPKGSKTKRKESAHAAADGS